MAYMCAVCFGDWTNQRCFDFYGLKIDYMLKSKEKNAVPLFTVFKLGEDAEKYNCSCLEKIDCGDNKTSFCITYKCARYSDALSAFNANDIQKFFENIGDGY